MENTRNIIYGLRDPRNDVYQYIGKSTVGVKRPISHLTKSHSPKVKEWVQTLSDNWLYPIIDVIEEVENLEDLEDREKYWINYYHYINPELLNIMLIEKPIVEGRSEEDELDFNFLVRIIYRIPDILKRERVFRNLTQQEMAELIGVGRSSISKIETSDSTVNFKLVQDYITNLKGLDILNKVKKERVRK